MILLAGLGNPGSRYRDTRHNVGYRFVDLLSAKAGCRWSHEARLHAWLTKLDIDGVPTLLCKPATFMNESGKAIAAVASYFKIPPSSIHVVHDDLDLPPWKVRIKVNGGHGGHNGIKSILHHLQDPNFIRIKIGIGRPPSGEVTPWVLGMADERDRQLEIIATRCLLQHLPLILRGEREKAANRIHLCTQEKLKNAGLNLREAAWH